MRFQIDELTAIGVGAEALLRLDADHRRLAHGQRLRADCAEVATRLFEHERAVSRVLHQARNTLRDLNTIDPSLKALTENLDQVVVGLGEVERELDRYRQQLDDDDPVALERVERRLQQVHDLCRKHRCEAGALPSLLTGLADELARLESRGTRIAELSNAVAAARARYVELATALTAQRRSASTTMAATITSNLRQLGLPLASFAIAIKQNDEPGPSGQDEIEFLVTANPDQPALPLRRVASGGELSRISLAIQVATPSSRAF